MNRQSILQRTLQALFMVGTAIFAVAPAHAKDHVPVTANAAEKPRLVLQITVDQFRGDLPTRYADRLGEGGLRYLLEEGIHYNNAHHAHANTETIVGHVTLATGAHPAAHGMIGNIWFDRTTGVTTYNIEDPDYRLLTEGADVDADTEIDPTQKAATSDGRSPRAILTTTFSDELASLTAGKAKIFGVSVKDRGAVSMAGHTGKAFWFSKATNQFVTSSYYYDEYPQWIVDWNAKKLPETYANSAWELLHPIDTYLFGDRDDQEWESVLGSYGRTFPHDYTTPENPYFSTFLTISPAGDRITTDLAKTVIAEEGLGDDEITDYLGVSYSATDYIGHFFGPSSLESEDNILQLDRTLADLFAYVDQEIGLENTLIVLSADHGAPEAPGYLKSIGIPADYVSPDEWDKEPAVTRIKNMFGIKGQDDRGLRPPLSLPCERNHQRPQDRPGRSGDHDCQRARRLPRSVLCDSEHFVGAWNGPRQSADASGLEQLQRSAVGQHLFGIQPRLVHQRSGRAVGGGRTRLTLALRHLCAHHLRRTRNQATDRFAQGSHR